MNTKTVTLFSCVKKQKSEVSPEPEHHTKKEYREHGVKHNNVTRCGWSAYSSAERVHGTWHAEDRKIGGPGIKPQPSSPYSITNNRAVMALLFTYYFHDNRIWWLNGNGFSIAILQLQDTDCALSIRSFILRFA